MKTAAAIEHARKVDDEAFAGMSRPQQKNESVVEQVPAEEPTVLTQIKRTSVWTIPKRSVIAIHDYFEEHPLWGEPVDQPLTIVTGVKRLSNKLGNVAKHCACGMLGPVLNRKETATGKLIRYKFFGHLFIICRPSRRSPLSISC